MGLFNPSGGGTPGGLTTLLQYNNAGAFGGVTGWSTNGTTALTGAASTALAVGGAAIGSNALAVTGSQLLSGNLKWGETSAFPMWKRNSAALNARLADDSADAAITALSYSIGSDIFADSVGGYHEIRAPLGGAIGFSSSFGNPGTNGWAGLTLAGFSVASGGAIGWTNSTTDARPTSFDTRLMRLAATNVRQGNVPSATPVAQTFTLGEASRSGTDTNIGGASGTLQSGLGTGTGAISALIFQTPTLGSTGTAAQAYATRLTLNETFAKIASGTQFWLGNAAVTGLGAGVVAALTNATIVVYDSAGQAYRVPCII